MGFRGSRVQIPPSRLSEEQASLRLPRWGFFFARTPSRRMFAQVLEAARQIPDQTQQHVHRSRLHVPTGFPTRERVAAEPEELGKFNLGQPVVFADRPDLVCRKEAIFRTV